MIVKCEAAGKLDKCEGCGHAKPHEYTIHHGCGNSAWCRKDLEAHYPPEPGAQPVLHECECKECAPEPVADEGGEL